MNDEIYEDQEPLLAPESDGGGSTMDDQLSTINNQQPSILAHSAFLLLDRLDFKSRRKAPSVLTVFRLYCMQNMTVAEIARQYRCSLSTVSDRLKVLRARTGLSPKSFRR